MYNIIMYSLKKSKCQKGGALSNLNKKELLRRIKKYEKKSNTTSKISMRNKKDVMINFLQKNVPQKKVMFKNTPKIQLIEGRTDAERKLRKKALKKIKKKKKEDKSIRNIKHKEIPSLEKYIEIKKYNLGIRPKSKKLKKKEPMKFIKGIDSKDKKKTLYNQKKWKQHKLKYNMVEKKNKVVLKIYEKERGEKKEDIKKEYKFNKELPYDKYKAEYKAKVDLIHHMRERITKN